MPPDSALAPCPDDVATLQAELTSLARRYRPARVGNPPRWDLIRSDFLCIRDMEAAQPPLDAAAVRTEFWRLVRDEGAERTDRVPTREDLHARHHWHGEIMARRCGRNPGDLDLGRTSALIAGRTDRATPVRLQGPASLPVETARGRPPMPLAWFDNPAARLVPSAVDPDHVLLACLAARHLAGYLDRPTGADFYRILTTGSQGDADAAALYELLTGLDAEDYPLLIAMEALSIRHVARAALRAGVERGPLAWWLNRYARKPAGWPENRPSDGVWHAGFWPRRMARGEFWAPR